MTAFLLARKRLNTKILLPTLDLLAPNPFIIKPSKIYLLGNLKIVTNSTDKNTFLTFLLIKLTLDKSENICYTLAKTKIIHPKNVRAKVAIDFT